MKYRIAYGVLIVSIALCVLGPIYAGHYRTEAVLVSQTLWKDVKTPEDMNQRMGNMRRLEANARRSMYATSFGALAFGVALVACLASIRRDIEQLKKNQSPNQAWHATSEPAPGAVSSAREG